MRECDPDRPTRVAERAQIVPRHDLVAHPDVIGRHEDGRARARRDVEERSVRVVEREDDGLPLFAREDLV